MNKENKIWRRKFIAFLKKKGIYEKWIYNIKDQHPTINGSLWCMLLDRIYENKSYNAIDHAFTWADTKDGHEFWSYYNIKWKRIVGNGKCFRMQ